MPNAENLEQDIIGNLIKGTLPIWEAFPMHLFCTGGHQ
jgi:hypothetical protein